MLAKLMPTLSISMMPAATRNATVSAVAPRRNASRMSRSVLRRRGPDRLQHVVHGRLVLGGFIPDRIEQLFHLGEVVGRQWVHRTALVVPGVRELLGEVDLPALRFGLDRGAGVDHD